MSEKKRTRAKTTSFRLSGIVDVDQRSIQGNDDSNDAKAKKKSLINVRMLMCRRTENVERRGRERKREREKEMERINDDDDGREEQPFFNIQSAWFEHA